MTLPAHMKYSMSLLITLILWFSMAFTERGRAAAGEYILQASSGQGGYTISINGFPITSVPDSGDPSTLGIFSGDIGKILQNGENTLTASFSPSGEISEKASFLVLKIVDGQDNDLLVYRNPEDSVPLDGSLQEREGTLTQGVWSANTGEIQFVKDTVPDIPVWRWGIDFRAFYLCVLT